MHIVRLRHPGERGDEAGIVDMASVAGFQIIAFGVERHHRRFRTAAQDQVANGGVNQSDLQYLRYATAIRVSKSPAHHDGKNHRARRAYPVFGVFF